MELFSRIDGPDTVVQMSIALPILMLTITTLIGFVGLKMLQIVINR